jgi:hypothetical protein
VGDTALLRVGHVERHPRHFGSGEGGPGNH